MAVKGMVFFDTNVLVYQFDRTAPTKQKRAEGLIERYILEGRAVISSQVIQEFMNVSLKKFDTKLSVEELELVMADLLKPLCAHVPSFDFYERALKLYSSKSVGFYGAMIIQAAVDLGCKTLYSEDLQDGQQFGALTIKNPFV
jgi:predicted nucleic acid-binding protein